MIAFAVLLWSPVIQELRAQYRREVEQGARIAKSGLIIHGVNDYHPRYEDPSEAGQRGPF